MCSRLACRLPSRRRRRRRDCRRLPLASSANIINLRPSRRCRGVARQWQSLNRVASSLAAAAAQVRRGSHNRTLSRTRAIELNCAETITRTRRAHTHSPLNWRRTRKTVDTLYARRHTHTHTQRLSDTRCALKAPIFAACAIELSQLRLCQSRLSCRRQVLRKSHLGRNRVRVARLIIDVASVPCARQGSFQTERASQTATTASIDESIG